MKAVVRAINCNRRDYRCQFRSLTQKKNIHRARVPCSTRDLAVYVDNKPAFQTRRSEREVRYASAVRKPRRSSRLISRRVARYHEPVINGHKGIRGKIFARAYAELIYIALKILQ